MRTFDELEAAWTSGPKAPVGSGSVRLIVLRRGDGEHEVASRAELSPEHGLHGDRWDHGPRRSLERQLTLMDVRVATLVADDRPLHLPGDNFLVDLDLSRDTAPAGTRLKLGTAVVEVSAVPHTGCKKFKARFGEDALRWVNDPANPNRRLRGINCRIVEAGAVWVGDAVQVLR
ncbi:MAG: MOSC domain-containing protein [Myxococcota bacterium]